MGVVREAYLMMVTDQNNNKFYNMVDNGNGTILVTYGRVGSKGVTKTYSAYDWDEIYYSKIRKGYKDVTDSRQVSIKHAYKPLNDPEIQELIESLQKVSRQYVEDRYSNTTITQKMIDDSQTQINEMAKFIDRFDEYKTYYNGEERFLRDFNKKLLKLYTIIPRKMGNVNKELCENIDDIKKKVVWEQQTLDILQVQAVQKNQTISEDKTILEAFNINMTKCTPEDMTIIKAAMKDLDGTSYKVNRAWVMTNSARDADFKQYLIDHGLKDDDKTVKYYWHGTKTENVFSIMVNGLQVNPSNAYITGRMFGDGIYFAPKASKSLNYTSLSGSYWAHGNSNVGYMFLNAVIMGHKLNTDSTWINGINLSNLDGDKFNANFANYHSIYAHAGKSLRNDECMVYNNAQVASRYLVEFKH